MKQKIGERICLLREQKGLTQEELAKALFVNRVTVSQWENGTRDLKTDYAIALADFFDITCDELLRGIKSENVKINRDLKLSNDAIETLLKYSNIKRTELEILEEAFRFYGEDISGREKYINLTSAIVSSDEYDFFLHRFLEFILKHRALDAFKKMDSNIKSVLLDENIGGFAKTELLVAIDRHLTYESRLSDLDFNEHIHETLDATISLGNFVSFFEELNEKLLDRYDVLDYRLNKSFQKLKKEILQQYTVPQNITMLTDRIISELSAEFEDHIDSFQPKELELLKKHLLGDSALQKEGAADGKHNPQEE